MNLHALKEDPSRVCDFLREILRRLGFVLACCPAAIGSFPQRERRRFCTLITEKTWILDPCHFAVTESSDNLTVRSCDGGNAFELVDPQCKVLGAAFEIVRTVY
jgi:hypothetical protein